MLSQLEETITLRDRHGRYPQANNVEDFRRNVAVAQQRIANA